MFSLQFPGNSTEIRQSTIYYAGLLWRWDKWIFDQASDVPRIIFYTFYRLRALKTLYFYFCNFIKKNKKINWKDFFKEFCKKSWKKNNTWNIRRLVDDSFVPSSNRPGVIYCRLTDFSTECQDYDLSHKEGNWRRSCMSWLISTRGMGSLKTCYYGHSAFLPYVVNINLQLSTSSPWIYVPGTLSQERHLRIIKWIKLLSCQAKILLVF